MVIDFDNIIQPRRGFEDYNAVALSGKISQLFTYKNTLLVYQGTSISYDAINGVFGTYSGNYSPLINGLRLKGLETNGNFYFTTSEGIKKISVATRDDIPSAIITQAGGIKGADLSGIVIPDQAGFLPAQSKVAYRMVFGTKDASNNLIIGAPSARVVLTNQSQEQKTFEVFTVNFITTSVSNGDYWTFNDSLGGYFVWYDIDGNGTQPVNSDTIDKTPIKVSLNNSTPPLTETQLATYTAQALGSVPNLTVTMTGSELQITLTEAGDVTDVSQGNMLPTNVLVTKIFDGNITEGIPAIAELNFSIPQNVTTDYFYMLYRTGVVSTSIGVTLNDIDPGDEQQFVYEAPITEADILAGEITVSDNTPETFRQSGDYLYTNAITGEGITQANNSPPIAQDMALFRNSTFYSNTKDFHRLTINMLSVDDYISGSTKLTIAQGNKYTEYTFVGVEQVINLTTKKRSDTVGGTYIELNSANNERQYYIWFDVGGSSDPLLPNKMGVRVPLELYDDTEAGSRDAIYDSMLLLGYDFIITKVKVNPLDPNSLYIDDEIVITYADSGDSIYPINTSSWTMTVPVIGDGEDVVAKEPRVSTSSSPAISIDATARSLVKVINRDPDSPVTAEYLSSNEDLPGKILLEAKSLEDNQFSVSISDGNLIKEFNPELSPTINIISVTSGTNTFVTDANHNLTVGTKVYVNDNYSISGIYTVQSVPSPMSFTLKGVLVEFTQPVVGIVFKASAISDNNTNPNRLMFSKLSQPEAVPLANYVDVGSKDKSIMRILALRDNLFVLKEDGIFIVSGSVAPDFTVRLLDNSAILIAPDSAVVLNNLIYALTTQGVVSISESGVSIVSRQIEDQIKKYTTSNFNYRYTSFGMAYETDRSYFLWLPELRSDTFGTQCFRYNSITNTWTRWTTPATCGLVNQLGDDKIYIGLPDRNIVQQERKNIERQDHADRSFARSLGGDAFIDTTVTLSSTAEVEVGDVITQEQYVSIPKLNRLLAKLDSDNGTTNKGYESELQQTVGANLGNVLISLVNKLNQEPNMRTFTVPSGLNDIEMLKTDYNRLITELNSPISGTQFKNYKQVTDKVTYEVVITEVVRGNTNQVVINFITWFIQGEIRVFKGIKVKVQWSPQHFGKPQELKQISEGTLIFDQNTIYSATISYASDRSADLVPINFKMNGPGFWASYPWCNTVWGGGGNDVPLRTLIPQNKSRCRYLTVQFEHVNAREGFKLIGISLEPRDVSTRGYR